MGAVGSISPGTVGPDLFSLTITGSSPAALIPSAK